MMPRSEVHATAIVEDGARLGAGVRIGPFCIVGSQAELGIGTAAAVHLGVAVPNLPYPCETFGPLRYERDVVAAGPRIEGGLLIPPDGPGLGVELDWEVIRAWRVDE
jgi:L-alanine-DL-glutamate epimerase-like enolase superfamily enzyme